MGLGATPSKVYGGSYSEGASSQYSQYNRTKFANQQAELQALRAELQQQQAEIQRKQDEVERRQAELEKQQASWQQKMQSMVHTQVQEMMQTYMRQQYHLNPFFSNALVYQQFPHAPNVPSTSSRGREPQRAPPHNRNVYRDVADDDDDESECDEDNGDDGEGDDGDCFIFVL